MGPIDLCVGILDAGGVALLGGSVSFLEEECVTVGVGFEFSYAQALPNVESNLPLRLQIKIENSWLLQHYVCLHTAMVLTMMVKERTSETVS